MAEQEVREISNEDGTVDSVELAAGLKLPKKLALVQRDPDAQHHGYEVEYRIEFQRSRYVCTGIHVKQCDGGPPVVSEGLRRITVAAAVRMALNLVLTRLAEVPGESARRLEYVDGVMPPPGIAAQGASDEVIGWAAQLYDLSHMLNIPPTKAVQDRLGVSRATAGRWVAEARRRGLISATEED